MHFLYSYFVLPSAVNELNCCGALNPIKDIDILEEFAYLNTLEKVQLELQETIQGESG